MSSVETDPNPDDNTIGAPTSLSRLADVALTKSDAPDPVAPGNSLTYTLNATNNGPSTGTNVTITDTLPTEFSFASATPPCTGTTTLTCPLGILPPGSGTSVVINGTVASGTATGTAYNSASASHGEADPNPGNNTATGTTTVGTCPERRRRDHKADTPDPVLAGQQLGYTIAFTNRAVGRDRCHHRRSASLRSRVRFRGSGVRRNAAGHRHLRDRRSRGRRVGRRAHHLERGAPPAGQHDHEHRHRDRRGTGSRSVEQRRERTTTIGAAIADLSLTKTDRPDPVAAGGALSYTLALTNNGPDDASSVVVTDTLPPGTTFVSADVPCGESPPSLVTCRITSLALGTTTTLSITVAVPAGEDDGAVLVNTATVAAATVDLVPGNNTATATTSVVAPNPPPSRSPSISGHVFDDLNGNGRLDPGEPDLRGVVVGLTTAGPDGEFGSADDVLVVSVTTSSPYLFENLLAGTYRVIVDTSTLPAGMVATGDFDGGTDSVAIVALTSDQSVAGVDFGYADAPAVGSGGSGLPFTGGQLGMSFAVAAGAILAGALMFLASRRRVRNR